MKILIISLQNNYLDVKQSHHDKFFLFEYLVNNYDNKYKYISVDELENNKGKLERYIVTKYGNKPDYIIGYSIFNMTSEIYDEISLFSNLVMILFDIHHGKSVRRYRIPILNKCKYVLNSYAYVYNRYLPLHDNNIFFPHSLAYKIEFNSNPINKILASGHLNKDIYPNRQIIYLESKKNKDIIYHKPDYQGYRLKEQDYDKTYGKRYYQLLNKYICCFTDDANKDRPYIVAKFFEIMGSGSLLLACNELTYHEFKKLGFIDNIHYISCNMDNYLEKIEYILDPNNRENIDKIRKNGYELANKKHNYKYRSMELDKILSNQAKLQEYKSQYDSIYKMIN